MFQSQSYLKKVLKSVVAVLVKMMLITVINSNSKKNNSNHKSIKRTEILY